MIMRINLPSLLVLAAGFLFASSTAAQVRTNPWGAREQSGYGRPTPLPRVGDEKQVPIFPPLDNPFGSAVIELALEITEFQKEQAVPILEAARAAAEPLLVDLAQAVEPSRTRWSPAPVQPRLTGSQRSRGSCSDNSRQSGRTQGFRFGLSLLPTRLTNWTKSVSDSNPVVVWDGEDGSRRPAS